MRKTVLIAFTDAELEAAAVRGVSEAFGASVYYYPIGRPSDFLDVLAARTGFPEPDAVVFHYPNPFVAHFLLGRLPEGTKLVIYWHLDIVKQKLLGKLFRGQNRRLVKRADRLIATSPPYAEGSEWLRSEKDKVAVIPNSIDAARLAMTPAAEAFAAQIREQYAGRTICLAVGRHTRYKGFDALIEAAKYLDGRFIVLIAGEGEETPRLRQLAGESAIVRFLGRVDDDALKGYLRAMDIFCFPSVTRNEAFGLALAEAMYFEKPAVTFTVPGSGVNYVCLDGEDGIEVPNGDARAYAEALKRLAADPDLRARLGQNGRRRVEENFLSDKFRDRIRALIDETTKDHHR